MPIKSQISNKTETFELVLTHEDVRDMINDPNVNFVELNGTQSIIVDLNQEFEIAVQKPSGSEYATPLRMKGGDKIIIRFSKKKLDAAITNLGDVDVRPCYSSISSIPQCVRDSGESVLLCDGTRVTFAPVSNVSNVSALKSVKIRRKK